MNIYSKQQKWKYILLGFAISIGVSSLFVTNLLVKEIKKEERKKIELWAKATKQLVNIATDGDYSLAIRVITGNQNIPLILVDESDSILEYRNMLYQTKLDSFLVDLNIKKEKVITHSFLRKELEHIKANGDTPIEINFAGDKQWIYYKDSVLLNRLRYYPVYQLGFIGLFMLIAYLTFSSQRKSEQNQVWAGMAKETAHQIGTPLSSLMAWVELLKNKKGDENILIEMRKDIGRLETITDRFSKIGSKTDLELVNLVVVIEQAIHYLKARLPEKIIFKLEMPKDPILISVNKVLLEWVIENLCKNATDAMHGKGKISIHIEDEDHQATILITDTGKGIEKSLSKTIFKPGVTSKKRGWGLGLSLAKRIIEQYHNGKIYVKNSQQEKGTTFCISLPKN